MNQPPHIPPAVLEWLETLFPDRLPTEPVSSVDFGVLLGEQRVLRKIRQAMKDAGRNALEA